MFKTFGSTQEVFVNQDEGMFVAFPLTLDKDVLTLETETRNGRTYAKAGSVVKEGAVIKGILAEEYDITDDVVTGRVVVEGYAWAHRLTAAAIDAAASLPKIIIMPLNYVKYELVGVDATAHKATIKLVAGAKFKSTISTTDVTATSLTVSAVALNTNADELTITFSAAGSGSIDAIASSAITASGATVKGMPIPVEV